MMKRSFFINTAGTVVNTEDLIDALKMGNIGAAGLDVYERKEQFSLVTTLLKTGRSFIHYTSLLPKCVNYRTSRLLTNEALGIARILLILMHGHTMAPLKTNLIIRFK
jgi:D-lactate dehydrogenase